MSRKLTINDRIGTADEMMDDAGRRAIIITWQDGWTELITEPKSLHAPTSQWEKVLKQRIQQQKSNQTSNNNNNDIVATNSDSDVAKKD